ncbi:MAG: alkaline phosphatase family protein [Candidatus Lambdaproteobacteria bacterium]|nr:alkaline phosphatase family protein [Candidatus Lambdaproteobacteria bacterium]
MPPSPRSTAPTSTAPTSTAPAAREIEHLRWPAEPAFYRPDHGRSLVGVFPTVFELLGREPGPFPGLLAHLPAASPRRARKVLVLCLDGFGFRHLDRAGRFRALYGDYGTWVTSVFPSITSCALTSIYQGLPPSRHGITGHLIWKDFPGAVVDMLRMQVVGAKASLTDAGFDVRRWQREPGLLAGPHSRGLHGYHLMHNAIVGSGLSTLCYGDTPLVGFGEMLEGVTKAARILDDLDSGWVGLYLATLDTLTHVLASEGAQSGLAVRHIEEALAWLTTLLSPRTLADTALVIAADHGDDSVHHWVPLHGPPGEWLQAHTRALGFSGRVLHVYLGSPADADTVRGWLADYIGAAGRVFAYDEVRELAGPQPDPAVDEPWLRQSLGDLVAILHAGHNWQRLAPDPDQEKPYASHLVSQHGGLSAGELFVPLVCAPLAALAPE